MRYRKAMAASSLLALIDDIASVLDDVALLTKAATREDCRRARRRPGAQRAAGVGRARGARAARRLGGGEGLARQQGDPRAGGARDQRHRALGGHAAPDGRAALFLCYEGFEKIAHQLSPRHRRRRRGAPRGDRRARSSDPTGDHRGASRSEKIKGAVRTDFILSAEIIVIALGTVAGAPFATRVAVLVGIALADDRRRLRHRRRASSSSTTPGCYLARADGRDCLRRRSSADSACASSTSRPC